MAKKIFLSPSNQSDNTYAYGGTNEAVQCGRIADAAKAALVRCGFEVKVNHMGTLAEKCKESNAWPADLHIPIHTNAYNGTVSGTRMFYYAEGSNSQKACKAIYDVLAPLTPGKSENTRAYPNLYEMNQTTMPSVYIEVDFHDVPEVAKWIIENVEPIGEAICRGVCNYYGVNYVLPGTAEKALTGWQEVDGKWYYYDAAGNVLKNQWIIGSKTSYYLGTDGAMVTGKALKVNADGELVPAGDYYDKLSDVPSEYRGTLDELIASGIIKGRGGSGEDLVIDLSEEAVRVLVMLDRARVFG